MTKSNFEQLIAELDSLIAASEAATPQPWDDASKYPAFIALSRTALPSLARKLKTAVEALQPFADHVKGKLPADSSDSITIESVHAKRLIAALNSILAP